MKMTEGIFLKQFILLICLFLLSFQSSDTESDHSLELIAKAAEEENFQIKSWQVVMDEKITSRDFDKFMNNIDSSYNVTTVDEHHTLKYRIVPIHKDDKMDHHFHAVKLKDDEITLQLVITSEFWDNQTMKRYNFLTKSLQNDYSVHFSRIFTCLKLRNNVIISDGSYYENVLKKLQITDLNVRYDNVQNSTYIAEFDGYTTLWDEKIVVNNEKINFQMMIKETTDDHIEIIIGTPIVLNEY